MSDDVTRFAPSLQSLQVAALQKIASQLERLVEKLTEMVQAMEAKA